ncbi:molybdopterin cofactor-binding domain-containing protein [Solicola sp. PLA-1-18]|uniref:xanthine dehydrogenase family protein molybdopterin-binding subunit n=1 Tax=Solicola sp. PLA-1-18 TaxID=3380532 RepID=UPI003B7FFD17
MTATSEHGVDRLEDAPDGLGRRRFLAYLVAAPTLTVTVLGADAAAGPSSPGSAPASAAVVPQPAEILDLGDALILAGLPTSGLLLLEVREDGTVRLELPRSEVGQGITTTFSMLVAEEMDVPMSDVVVELSDARPELLMNQLTGGSNTVRSLFDPVRNACASARARLRTAAAQQWKVAVEDVSTKDGSLIGPRGLEAGIGTLTNAAAALGLPNLKAAPKDVKDYALVGKATNRVDARKAVTGTLEYATDLAVEGAMPVMVARPPTINGTPQSFNEAEIKAMPGVIDAKIIETGVAIMAETFGQALDAKQALKGQWGKGTVDDLSDADIFAKLHKATLPFTVPRLPIGVKNVGGEFDFHFASHAPLEPNSAIADVRKDRATIWAGLKSPVIAQQTIASELGLPQDEVTVHVLQGGGSFGRRLFFDAALEAARASKAFGRPVRLMWTRIDDMRHGRARAASHHKVRATYGLGKVLTWEQRVASVETDFRHGLGEILTGVASQLPVGGNVSFAQTVFLTTVHTPYKFGAVTNLLNEVPLRMHTGSFRSVYSANTRGSEEIVVDELAKAMGKDPYQFRRSFLSKPNQVAVLDKVAKEGEWGRTMPAGFAQGIAFHDEYKSCTACLVEIDARDPKAPKVTRATIAADVGFALNPRGLEAQLLGGLSDAVGTTLRAGLHIEDGLPLEGSYSQFHYTRQADYPNDVKVFVMDSSEEPGGAGELGLPAAVGAIANAYARATGTVPRTFPINFPVDFEPFPAQ